jgi:hypothetical protein
VDSGRASQGSKGMAAGAMVTFRVGTSCSTLIQATGKSSFLELDEL